MTNEPLPICEKLRARANVPSWALGKIINPDGPKAAAIIEGLVEALIDWQNCWSCPATNFEGEAERLLSETEAALKAAGVVKP